MDQTTLTLGILLVGVVTVIGGILVLRLHAFLALVLAALLVGALTPAKALLRVQAENAARKNHVRVISTESADEVVLGAKKNAQAWDSKAAELTGPLFIGLRADPESGELSEAYRLQLDRFEDNHAIARYLDTPDTTWQPGDIVLTPRDWEAAQGLAAQNVADRVTSAFGSTCASIGILIAMASIIGKCLLDSGGADRIVRSTLRVLGERGAPLGFVGSGFVLGIPVFFDTVFYLMIPLGKAMALRTKRNYLLVVLSIVTGATMAHSLVPPTPGPLYVADELGVNIGLMMLGGCIVGGFTCLVGYGYAVFANRLCELPLRESPEFTLKDMQALSDRPDDSLPPLWLSLLPILLPVALIGGYAIMQNVDGVPPSLMHVAGTLGDKNVALLLAAGIAVATLIRQKHADLKNLAESMQAALAGAGVIILITAAGGAFGAMLRQTGVAGLVRELSITSPAGVITLAFLITTAIRTAQGSATVAMITSVGILSGIAASGSLGFDPLYLALAIGCGSKPIAWMNDSGFWVISKMSGMTEAETLKYVTPLTTLMGLAGLAATIVGVSLFPMAG